MSKIESTIKIEIDSTELDQLIEKADRLAELLREAQQIVNTFSGRDVSSIPEPDLRYLRDLAIQDLINSLVRTV